MIDTDKYEGHTPAPWKLDWPDDEIIKGCMFHIISDNKELLERFECKPSSIDEMEDKYKTDAIYDPYITSISCGPLYTKDGEFISEINARLIADAPLLLAEVKRLRSLGMGTGTDGIEATGWVKKINSLDAEVKRWHKVRDYILEKASYPTVKKLHLKDLLNFMEEVIE